MTPANDNPANRLLACAECDSEIFVAFVLDGAFRIECERCAANMTKEFARRACSQ
jgi:hypothetical protein